MNRKQNHEKKRLLRGPVLVRQSDKPVRSTYDQRLLIGIMRIRGGCCGFSRSL